MAVLTLNRPDELNPIDSRTLVALENLLAQLVTEDAQDAIVLTGAGSAFSAGGDLKAYQHLYARPEKFEDLLETWARVCGTLETCGALTVAMLNGTCVAGGLELALACDLITIADTARVGDGHLRYLQLPGAGGSQRLVRALGVQRAKHWLLSARLFSAEEAVESGLAVAAFPDDQLEEATLALISKSIVGSRSATAAMKQLVRIAQENDLQTGLELERREVLRYVLDTDEARRGLQRFAERGQAGPGVEGER